MQTPIPHKLLSDYIAGLEAVAQCSDSGGGEGGEFSYSDSEAEIEQELRDDAGMQSAPIGTYSIS